MNSDYVLLTGSTGLLGRYLLRDLLLREKRVAVIVRPSRRHSARQRIEEILQHWEKELDCPLPRPVVLPGDICEPFLGLDESDRFWVANHCTSIVHSAASLTFHADSTGEPERSNVGGVKHMLQLCEEARISEVHYISTAYVAGLTEDVVYEDEPRNEQDFRNDYERSKFQAELLVRSADFIGDLTVYRPAVIAGDSKTGYTNTYHGLYMYLKLMSVLVRNTEPGPDGVRFTPVQFDMTGDEARNIVAVDWVSAVICDLYMNPAAHGRTYHLAPEEPVTPRQIIEAGYRYYNSRGVTFSGKPTSGRAPISEIDHNTHSNIGMYKEYEVCDPRFDLTNLKSFAGHLPCPVMDEAMLHEFLKYGENDRWGKRKPALVPEFAYIEDHLVSQVTNVASPEQTATVNARLGRWRRRLGLGISW
ncbi:MAG: SDR family oxidoreductase [Pirellulaceae bacterium]